MYDKEMGHLDFQENNYLCIQREFFIFLSTAS